MSRDFIAALRVNHVLPPPAELVLLAHDVLADVDESRRLHLPRNIRLRLCQSPSTIRHHLEVF